MPRSGTTLIEQIISAHPNVYAGDELNILPNLVNRYLSKKNSLSRIKKEYLKKIRRYIGLLTYQFIMKEVTPMIV